MKHVVLTCIPIAAFLFGSHTILVDQTRAYLIPSEPLPDAIGAWGRITQADYLSGASPRVISNPVSGKFGPQHALCQLLQGTGFSFAFYGDSYAIGAEGVWNIRPLAEVCASPWLDSGTAISIPPQR